MVYREPIVASRVYEDIRAAREVQMLQRLQRLQRRAELRLNSEEKKEAVNPVSETLSRLRRLNRGFTEHSEAKVEHSEAKVEHSEAKVEHSEAKVEHSEAKVEHRVDPISYNRERVLSSYREAEERNRRLYLDRDIDANSEYVFTNQKTDARNIIDLFYKTRCRIVSVQKQTKVGADGLMIELETLFATHADNSFVKPPENMLILTGMSNRQWEMSLKAKCPSVFSNKIFHHGKLKKSQLETLTNAFIIIDEIDTGNKRNQVMDKVLKTAGLLDIQQVISRNIHFVVISATMVGELYELRYWGDLHKSYTMTTPDDYVGTTDFYERGIIKQFYNLKSVENSERWVREDILENYGHDYRVHIIRVNGRGWDIQEQVIRTACSQSGVNFRCHTSIERLSREEFKNLFVNLTSHLVIAVKGLLRRADYIPNALKLKIGAVHELYTSKVDDSVQIQGLIGRMTGYWKSILDSGHKTGPFRTNIKSVENYISCLQNPDGNNSYTTANFSLQSGVVVCENQSLLNPANISNLQRADVVQVDPYPGYSNREIRIAHTEMEINSIIRVEISRSARPKRDSYDTDDNGFKMTCMASKRVHSEAEFMELANKTRRHLMSNMTKTRLKPGEYTYRKYVFYGDVNDISTERYGVIWVRRAE
jgi:hypothetical protein